MTVSPQMLDGVLWLVGVEAIVVSGFLAYRGMSDLVRPVLAFLAGGFCLLFAVRLALSGANGGLLAASLLGGFAFHAGFLLLLVRRGA